MQKQKVLQIKDDQRSALYSALEQARGPLHCGQSHDIGTTYALECGWTIHVDIESDMPSNVDN